MDKKQKASESFSSRNQPATNAKNIHVNIKTIESIPLLIINSLINIITKSENILD